MFYKRNEPFRYTFGQPIKALVETIENEDDPILTSNRNWEVFIFDISPNGMKIATIENIKDLINLPIRITFWLNHTYFEVTGTILWKKTLGQKYLYGIFENSSEQYKKQLKAELKIYSKKHFNDINSDGL